MNFETGEIDPSVHSAVRTYKELQDLFLEEDGSIAPGTVIYRTYGCPGDGLGQDLLYGTTVLMPGSVAGEFFMTRGHFHTKPERGETCLTLRGSGKLLLVSREGKSTQEAMEAGSFHLIDGRLAHRVVNTGEEPLVFFVTWIADCGHEYGDISFPRVVRTGDGSNL